MFNFGLRDLDEMSIMDRRIWVELANEIDEAQAKAMPQLPNGTRSGTPPPGFPMTQGNMQAAQAPQPMSSFNTQSATGAGGLQPYKPNS